MKYYVIINGESSLDIQGLAIESLPAISKPLMRSKREEIDGRDGDIITQLGFSAYDKTLKIGLWGNYDIDEIISYFNQDGIITFSNEPDMYYNFTILNRIDFINQLEAFRKATITIHCQPFKYKEEETETLEIEEHQEEGTSFNLEGTIEAPMQIELKGNTSQVQLSGKNLYIPIVWTKTHNQVSYTFYNDGSILVNGTANGASFSMYTSEATSYMQYLDAGTYTLSGGSNKVQLKILDESGNAITNTTSSSTTATFTLNSRIKIWLRCEVANTIQVNNEIIKPMIELGSTATPYEQYCGGTPSPNPSYPQDIHNVSGDNDIVVCGKNLFDKDNANKVNDAYISASGKISTASNNKIIYIPCKPNTTYTITKILSQRYRVATYSSVPQLNSETSNYAGEYSDTSITITSGANDTYLAVWYYNGGLDTLTEQQILDSIQIEYGNQATPYEAYNGTTHNIDLPVENLFDKDNANVLSAYINTSGVVVQDTQPSTLYIPCKPNTTYTITKPLQTTQSSNRYRYGCCSSTPSLQTQLSKFVSLSGGTTETIQTFTTDSTAQYLVLNYAGGSIGEYQAVINGIQIEYGTKSNTYTPFGTTPIELNKIGTHQDYIYKENDKWYLHKEIGKIVLDGSENWVSETAYTGYYRFDVSGILPTLTRGNDGFNNRFTQRVNQPHGDYQYLYLQQNNGYIHIQILQSLLTNGDVSTFKTWLASNNVNVYYILATPTNTEITDTTLIEQLDELESATSRNGETNINQVNNDEMFILGVDYFTGTDNITITNHGNYYSKPKLTLTGTGNIGIYLNDNQIFQVALGTNETIIIDTDKMEAYYESTLKNRQVIGDYNSFKLLSGENTIRISGTFSKLQVDNYSRWI